MKIIRDCFYLPSNIENDFSNYTVLPRADNGHPAESRNTISLILTSLEPFPHTIPMIKILAKGSIWSLTLYCESASLCCFSGDMRRLSLISNWKWNASDWQANIRRGRLDSQKSQTWQNPETTQAYWISFSRVVAWESLLLQSSARCLWLMSKFVTNQLTL